VNSFDTLTFLGVLPLLNTSGKLTILGKKGIHMEERIGTFSTQNPNISLIINIAVKIHATWAIIKIPNAFLTQFPFPN